MNIKRKELAESQSETYDREIRKYIFAMCKKCKFYDNGCTKKRLIRECVKKGLKNKD